MQPNTKSTLFDLLIGMLAALGSFAFLYYFSFPLGFMLMAPLPFMAGFIRGKNPEESKVIKVALMNGLFYLLIFLFLLGQFHYILVIVLAVAGTALGIYARQQLVAVKTRVLVACGLFFVSVMALGCFGLPAYLGSPTWDQLTVKAPAYKLLSPQGDTIRSQDYAGKIVVMDFWATWCKPCRAQFPELEKVHKRYKGNERIVFLMINTNDERDSFDKVCTFIKKSEYDLPFMIDIKGKTSMAFNVELLPSAYIIDPKGVVRKLNMPFDRSQISDSYCQEIDALLAKH